MLHTTIAFAASAAPGTGGRPGANAGAPAVTLLPTGSAAMIAPTTATINACVASAGDTTGGRQIVSAGAMAVTQRQTESAAMIATTACATGNADSTHSTLCT